MANTLFIRVERRNSAGFSGMVPFTNTCKFGVLVSWIYFLANVKSLLGVPVRASAYSVNPFSLSTEKAKVCSSFRTLQSINNTFKSAFAHAFATFTAVKVVPSCGNILVKIKVFAFFFLLFMRILC